MTIIELLVVIAILGIFMGIAIPSVTRSFQSMEQAKKVTSRYPDAWRALDRVSNMLRQTFPEALTSGEAFVGRSGSYDAGGAMIPSDELRFPILDTGYARSSLGAAAEAGVTETLLPGAVGLDFSYLDGSSDPPEWVQEWPPLPAQEAATSTDSVRLPKAVKVTVFMLGAISPQPTSFTTVVNVPSG
jgi:prepilin-type N-terminal cleavage/methylation domain-containing protein